MLLVVSLDGATFDLLDHWIPMGVLPNIAYLIKNGTRARLESTMPPITAPAWASFMTGKKPGKHGVFDFFVPGIFPLKLVTSRDIQSTFFWDYLQTAALKVGILNLPVTHPPRPVNGFLIPGLLSPDHGHTTWPPDLLDPYRSQLGPYRLTPPSLYWPGNDKKYLSDLIHLTDLQIAYARKLLQDHQPELGIVHFLAPDIAQHKLWKHLDSDHPWHNPETAPELVSGIHTLFRHIDNAIGDFRDIAPEATIIILSDHGFGPLWRTVNLNNWFRQHGFLEIQRNSSVRFRHWLARYPLFASLARLLLRYTGSAELLRMEDIDWEKTLAFSMGHCGQVYINRRGDFAHGSVAPNEVQAIMDRVVDCLNSLIDPDTGEKLISRIIPAQASDKGPLLRMGPDFHIIMDGYRTVAHPMFASDKNILTEIDQGDSGYHRMEGIFIAHGPPIRCGITLEKARIIDLAPTILHLFGIPVPEDMDGQVLQDALTPAFMTAHPIKYQSPLPFTETGDDIENEDQSKIEERLRKLGYFG